MAAVACFQGGLRRRRATTAPLDAEDGALEDQGRVEWRPEGPRARCVAPRRKVAWDGAQEDQTGHVKRHPEGPRARRARHAVPGRIKNALGGAQEDDESSNQAIRVVIV